MKNNFISIGNRKVGLDFEPLVIAELGINHGGDLKTAFEMVDAAARAGVEVLKHQTHIVAEEMSGVARQVIPSHTKESIFQIMENCALSEADEITLQQYVTSKGMIFISTPFSRAAVDRLVKMDVPAIKIGSGECNNYPLLKYIAEFGKPVILSTGMNTLQSIEPAVKIFKDAGVPVALLHTTNVYPTPPELVRYGAFVELMNAFPGLVYGLSDHTTSNLACFGAVALGASILERHFTDHMNRQGPDIVCSMDEKSCNELISGTATIAKMRGGTKVPADAEKPTIDFAYASVVTIADIKKGDVFSKENLWVKRPGTGEILAVDYEQLLGKKAVVDIPADTLIEWNHVVK
jgi:N-acetylneuraminate synthase